MRQEQHISRCEPQKKITNKYFQVWSSGTWICASSRFGRGRHREWETALEMSLVQPMQHTFGRGQLARPEAGLEVSSLLQAKLPSIRSRQRYRQTGNIRRRTGCLLIQVLSPLRSYTTTSNGKNNASDLTHFPAHPEPIFTVLYNSGWSLVT